MGDKSTEKQTNPAKSFMTAGPTLHYSHANVRRSWWLAVVVYLGACLFWSKILTGYVFLFEPGILFEPARWGLGYFTGKPLSIYEYPWQIIVLGLLMGILGCAGVIISQLMSFRYSIPFILLVVFVARLPFFGVILLISCIAVACRPLRFRSRYIAIALCLTPQLAYWAIFGGSESVDPLRWGISYAPWIGAWLTGLAIAGIVIGIGHYTRYRPGLTGVVTGLYLISAFFIFQSQISFSELDYQLYIARNNPEEFREFHNHNLSDVIDKAMDDPDTRKMINTQFFPTEPEPLKKELISDISFYIVDNKWPFWLKVPPELQYQKKRALLLQQYEFFIGRHPNSKRMPIALYYKGILEEYVPNVAEFEYSGILSFHKDYPQSKNLPTWQTLLYSFPESAESLEARWRIAFHLAGRQQFTKAAEYCALAKIRIKEKLNAYSESAASGDVPLPIFNKPAQTVMTVYKLKELNHRFNQLESLIANAPQMKTKAERRFLAEFIKLNPYQYEYSDWVANLISKTPDNSPLMDNLKFAKAMSIPDDKERAVKLREVCLNYPGTDGGVGALYKLGLLNVRLWKSPQTSDENRVGFLLDAKSILSELVGKYPESHFVSEAFTTLNSLPELDK